MIIVCNFQQQLTSLTETTSITVHSKFNYYISCNNFVITNPDQNSKYMIYFLLSPCNINCTMGSQQCPPTSSIQSSMFATLYCSEMKFTLKLFDPYKKVFVHFSIKSNLCKIGFCFCFPCEIYFFTYTGYVTEHHVLSITRVSDDATFNQFFQAFSERQGGLYQNVFLLN